MKKKDEVLKWKPGQVVIGHGELLFIISAESFKVDHKPEDRTRIRFIDQRGRLREIVKAFWPSAWYSTVFDTTE